MSDIGSYSLLKMGSRDQGMH